MNIQLKKRNEGFTIIEVLIVLAIAGLIMLIVFLAVPALQRNQKNNARTGEASRISTAVTECLANRNGVKTSCDNASEIGLTVTGAGASAQIEGYQQFTSVSFPTAVSVGSITGVNVTYNAKCNPDGATATTTGAGPRDFAVQFKLEPAIDRCIGS